MAGLPTTQRDQIMLAVGILMLLGGGAYWYFVDDPQRADLVKNIAHIDTLNASNQRAKAQLARGTAAAIRKEADSLRANLDLMRTLVPAANDVPALIEQVSNAARRVRLELASIDPQPPIELTREEEDAMLRGIASIRAGKGVPLDEFRVILRRL